MDNRERLELLDKLNLCHKCEKAPQMPNRKFCAECLEKIAEYNAKRYDPLKAHEYQARRRELYQQKKEQGICVRCSKPATHGLYCYEHSIKEKKRSQINAARRKRERHARGLIPEYRIKNRLCLRCGTPIEQDNNTLFCNECRKKCSEWSKIGDKSYQKQLNNLIWRSIKRNNK